jgi:hypothetical protein
MYPNEDDKTVVTSNTGSSKCGISTNTPPLQHFACAAFSLKTKDALGATQIFIMEGMPVVNKQPTTCPLVVFLADGSKVTLTHMCDIHIDGLPVVLTGHITPELPIASLFGIVVLTEAGCKVRFDKSACTVWYNNRIILKGGKDKATNLWMLPIGTNPSMSPHHNAVGTPSMAPVNVDAMLIRLQRKLRFSCILFEPKPIASGSCISLYAAPCISTLLKAIRHGFLKGCPNLRVAGVTRYLNPSPATAKGHMKWPCMGIGSTRQNELHANVIPPVPNDPCNSDNIQ